MSTAMSLQQMAAQYNNICIKERKKIMTKLRKELCNSTMSDAKSSAVSKMQAHMRGLFRHYPAVQVASHKGRTPFSIPEYSRMDCLQWIKAEGPFHVLYRKILILSLIFRRFGGSRNLTVFWVQFFLMKRR
jgi:hypothetical protein